MTLRRLRGTARVFAAALAALVPLPLLAQITFANTSPGRPFTVEDATAIARSLLDASIASAGLQREAGRSIWSAAPGLAYGLASRTEVQIRLPLSLTDSSASRTRIAGASVSLMYALNVETRTLPAIAIRAGLLMPVGNGPAEAHESVRAMVTRTFSWGRAHFNHEYTFGAEPGSGAAPTGASRWTSGLAVDRAFPRRGLLLGAEGVARRRLMDARAGGVLWDVRGGGRYQLTRNVTLDATLTRTIGDYEAWGAAFGIGMARGLATLLPGLGRWGP